MEIPGGTRTIINMHNDGTYDVEEVPSGTKENYLKGEALQIVFDSNTTISEKDRGPGLKELQEKVRRH